VTVLEKYLLNKGRGDLKTKLEYAFALYDEDKNGYLDRNEIREVIRDMINLFGSNVNKAKTTELVEECINKLDVNNDGKVSKGTCHNIG